MRSAVGLVEIVFLSGAFLVLGYLLLLTLLASLARKATRFPVRLQRKCAVVIPAFNEAAGIAETVRSVLAVEYPQDRFEAVVIADNCTDDTASRARAAGATALERNEPEARGKGHALKWGFDCLMASGKGYDAFVVVDADSVVTPNYLSVVNWYLEIGARAIQSSDLVDPANDAWNAQMTRIGFLLYNYVRPLGRKVLGGTAGLRGNGMCFTAEVLRQFPWKAFSVTEDLEYGLHLLLGGVKVTFAPEATVFATMPREPGNAVGQRARWEGGRFALVGRYALPLLREFFAARSLACLDAFFDLVTPALVNLIALVLLAAFLSSVLWLLGIDRGKVYTLLWVIAAGAGCTHLIAGLRIARADSSTYRTLANLPRYALWKLSVYLRMPGRWSRDVWTRTTRESR